MGSRACGGLFSLSLVMYAAVAAGEPALGASACVGGYLDRALHESDAVLAKRYEDRGQACLDSGNFAFAYDALYHAYASDKSSAHLWQLALIEVQAGYPGSALRHVREYLTRKDATKDNLKRAAAVKENLRPLVGRLHVTAPPGTTIDAFGPVGVTPLADFVPLDPDDLYILRASGPTLNQRCLIVASANEDIAVTFPLPPRPPEGTSDAGATSK